MLSTSQGDVSQYQRIRVLLDTLLHTTTLEKDRRGRCRCRLEEGTERVCLLHVSLDLDVLTYEVRTAEEYQPLAASEPIDEAVDEIQFGSSNTALLPAKPRNGEDLLPLDTRQTAELAFAFCLLWFIANWSVNASLDYTTVASATILSSTSGQCLKHISRSREYKCFIFDRVLHTWNWKNISGGKVDNHEDCCCFYMVLPALLSFLWRC